jgi:hypothetical protein
MNYFLPTTPRLLFPRLLSPHHNDAMRLGPAPVVQKPQVVALAPVVIVPAYQSCCWSPYCTRASPLQYHHVATLHFQSTTSKIMHHRQDPPSPRTRACWQPPALHHPNTSAGQLPLPEARPCHHLCHWAPGAPPKFVDTPSARTDHCFGSNTMSSLLEFSGILSHYGYKYIYSRMGLWA